MHMDIDARLSYFLCLTNYCIKLDMHPSESKSLHRRAKADITFMELLQVGSNTYLDGFLAILARFYKCKNSIMLHAGNKVPQIRENRSKTLDIAVGANKVHSHVRVV